MHPAVRVSLTVALAAVGFAAFCLIAQVRKRGSPMKLGRKVTLAFSAVALLAGAMTAAAATSAYAGSGNQWCNDQCHTVNAWNGGPFVKSYQYPAVNNDFTWVNNDTYCGNGVTTSTCPGHGIPAGYFIGGLKFTGSGAWVGHCVGDESNDPNQADTSLDVCNTGWGVNFVYLSGNGNTCGPGKVVLYNIHWNGYLRIPDSNGSKIFLNNAAGSCIHLLPAA